MQMIIVFYNTRWFHKNSCATCRLTLNNARESIFEVFFYRNDVSVVSQSNDTFLNEFVSLGRADGTF